MKNPSTVPHKKTPYASAYGVFVSIGIRVISDEGGCPQRDDADEIGHDRAEIEGERHIVFENEVVDRPAEQRDDNDDFELHLVLEIEKPSVHTGGRRGQQPEPAVGL